MKLFTILLRRKYMQRNPGDCYTCPVPYKSLTCPGTFKAYTFPGAFNPQTCPSSFTPSGVRRIDRFERGHARFFCALRSRCTLLQFCRLQHCTVYCSLSYVSLNDVLFYDDFHWHLHPVIVHYAELWNRKASSSFDFHIGCTVFCRWCEIQHMFINYSIIIYDRAQ